jgi:hypothetical protein
MSAIVSVSWRHVMERVASFSHDVPTQTSPVAFVPVLAESVTSYSNL